MEEVKTLMLSENEITQAVKVIQSGGTVAFRTETFYGIGANLRNSNKIFGAKQIEGHRNYVMFFSSLEKAVKYFGDVITDVERKIFTKFQGGLTIVLPKSNIAVRIPNDPIAVKLLSYFDEPLLVSSANISGMPAATTWQQVLKNLGGRVDAVIASGPCRIGAGTTIIKMNGYNMEVIRHGCTDVIQIQKFIDTIRK